MELLDECRQDTEQILLDIVPVGAAIVTPLGAARERREAQLAS